MSNHGAASWPSPHEIESAGLLDETEIGVRLGNDPKTGQPLFFGGEQHILTVAPPGAGKTVCTVLPTLATYPGTVVTTDPKGATTAQTAELREKKFGHKIIVLNPWGDEITKGLGRDLGDTGFNPLGSLKVDDPALHENARMLAGLLCPTPPGVDDPYWTRTARRIITGCLLHLVLSPDHSCTLPALYDLVRTARAGWGKIAAAMISLGLDAYAAEILSPIESEKQWSGVHGAILDATEIYAPVQALGKHVAKKDGFNPDDLKRENMTVYIVIPSNRREENKAWLALVMALCAEAVGRPGPSKPVLLLAEEFANLGYMPSIARAMAEFREAGLRCWLVIQNLHQLHRIYGKDGAQEIINLCGIKQFFRVDDLELARQLEATIGTYTATQASYSDGWSDKEKNINVTTGDKTANMNQSRSISEMAVPLLRAQDIINLPNNMQIITFSGFMRPMLALLTPYYYDVELRDIVASNPYKPDLPPIASKPMPPEPLLSPEMLRKAAILSALFTGLIFVLIGVIAYFSGGIHGDWAGIVVWLFINWILFYFLIAAFYAGREQRRLATVK